MRKIVLFIALCISIIANAQTTGVTDTITADTIDVVMLDEVTVTSLYLGNNATSNMLDSKTLIDVNVGQEPSHVFKHMPNIYAMSDNGTEFGYGYYRIRGLDQTRINVTLDGMPWNEAEDFGAYFANSPDLMSSMHNIAVSRGTSSRTNGISASAGSIILESVNLKTDTTSYTDFSYGSSNAHKASVVYNMGQIKGWGFHFKATQSGTDGYRDNSGNQSHAVTAKVGYTFNQGMTVDFLTMNGYHTNQQGFIGAYEWEIFENPKANGNVKEETDNWFQTVDKLQIKARVSDKTFITASTYLQYQDGAYRMNLDNYMWRLVDTSWESTDKLYNYGLTHYLYGMNFFLRSNATDFMDITMGVNSYRFQRRHYMVSDGSRNLTEDDMYDNTGYKTDVTVLLGMDFYPVKGLTTGFNIQYRYTDFTYFDNGRLYDFDGATLWNFVNGGIDLRYDFNSIHALYAKLSVSNREPTRSTMFGGSEVCMFDDNGRPVLATTTPELVHDVELGYDLKMDMLRSNINLFYMNFKDELVLTGTYGINGLPEHINAYRSFRTGIEVTFDYEPIGNLHLVNSTAWSKNLMKLTEDATYKTHVLSPDWTLDQDIHYDWKNVTIGTNLNLHSEMYTDLDNIKEHQLPVNMSLNAYINTRFFNDKLSVSLRLKNITNRLNYYNGCVGATGEMLYFQEARFSMMLSARYKF